MDPLSISAPIATLLVASTKIIHHANLVRLKYKSAAMTMASIASECATVNVALAQLQVVFTSDDLVSYKSRQGGEEILQSVDAVTLGCSMTFSVIEQRLDDAVKEKGVESSISGGVSRKEKAKFVWSEEDTKDLLEQLRGYKSSLTLLLGVLNQYVLVLCHFRGFQAKCVCYTPKFPH